MVSAGLSQAAEAPRLPVWAAAPTTQILQEAKTFQSAGVTLQGTLYMPRRAHPVAAIVVTHAAATPLRNASLYSHLTQMLPPLGVAVFVYDRRGSGASGGKLGDSDYDLLADDAIAAARMLAGDPRIDRRRLGVWGLSQGGWLAVLAARRSAVFSRVISVSAPLVTPDVQMQFSSANTLAVFGCGKDDIAEMTALRKAVDDYMRYGGDRAAVQRRLDADKTKPWFRYLYMGEKVSDRAVSRWRKEIEHDPMATLEAVKAPTLIIYGATDPVVPVATSIARLRSLQRSRSNLTVAVIAGADHGMQTHVPAKALLDPDKASELTPDAPEYFALLGSWLTAQKFAASPVAGP